MKTLTAVFTSSLFALALLCAPDAEAVAFTLNNSTATVVGTNEKSDFYEVDFGTGVETGTAKDLFAYSFGGNASTGWTMTITWTNPKPILTSAFLKAGSSSLIWDAADLALFNTGNYDSLILVQNGIANQGNGNFLQISHGGLNGGPGTSVPDGGSTIMLLGLALGGAGALRRHFGK